MGTRAVVHVNLEPFHYGKDIWIATHWDGYPEGLGKTLERELSRAVKRVQEGKDDLGGALQKAVFKASAEHHIDLVSVDGMENFDKEYGDWAEYIYEIDKDLNLKVKKTSGLWGEREEQPNWKVLRSFKDATRSAKKLREMV